MNRLVRIICAAFGLALGVNAAAQTKSFTPVDGPNLKSKIESAITLGRANAPQGRFWVAYQFEVRPGVAIDFEIVGRRAKRPAQRSAIKQQIEQQDHRDGRAKREHRHHTDR